MQGIRILGVDPGSRITGYACVEVIRTQIQLISHGALKLTPSEVDRPFADRLKVLSDSLSALFISLKPQVLAVEKIFFAKNADSALKLGHARGVILLCGANAGVEIAEYSPTEMKQALVGTGRADKNQVAQMVQYIVGKRKFQTPDASDATGLAICHALRLIAGQRRQAIGIPGASLHPALDETLKG